MLAVADGVGAATTLTVVEIEGESVRPFHVGDSFMLITGQRGKVKSRTIPHSPTGYAVASGLLDEKEALHHDERHVISNVIGSAEMRIDVGSPIELAPKDTDSARKRRSFGQSADTRDRRARAQGSSRESVPSDGPARRKANGARRRQRPIEAGRSDVSDFPSSLSLPKRGRKTRSDVEVSWGRSRGTGTGAVGLPRRARALSPAR